MSDRLLLASAFLAFALAFTAAVNASESVGTVTLYPEAGFSPAMSAQTNRVERGTCTGATSPMQAVSSVNYSKFPVSLYATSDCSGTPVTILRPYRQPGYRAPAHVPVNSARGLG